MRKRHLTYLPLFAALTLGVLLASPVWSQAPDPTPTSSVEAPGATMEPTATLAPTSTPEPTPSATVAPSIALAVTGVEPRTMLKDAGGTLSIYGTGFTAGSVVRLVGYGLLSTIYTNGTALTAQIPAGVPVGVYDLEIGDGTQSATLVGALTIVASTPTPTPRAPEAPPPPGRPILTVRNYAVEPAQVRAGQTFVVTIEVYNNGSRAAENMMAVFPGESFLPVGDSGQMIGQLHINHVVVIRQQMRAPTGLGPGIHQLAVNLGANDWEGNHYDYPQRVPVEMVGGGSSGPTGRPRLVVDTAHTEPSVLVPGASFTLTLQLTNEGSRTAREVFATASGETVIPTAGGGVVSVESIAAGEGTTVTLPLLLGDVETGGRQMVAISLAYGDASGGTYSDEQRVSVDVDTGLSRRPQLVITAYETTPSFLTPGDSLNLTIVVANVGGGDAERLTLALGGEGGAHLEPLIPLGAGNVVFVPVVGAGMSVEITRQLVVDGSADPKAYNLPIALAYDDSRGSRHDDVQRLSLVVRRRAELLATFYREPEAMMVGSATPLSLELVNVGLSAVNVVEVSASSPRMRVVAEGTPFMGPVEVGGSAPLDVSVTPQESGTADLVVSVTYRDDFNQLQVLTRTLTVEVTAGQGGAGPTAPALPGQTAREEPKETVWRTIGRALKGFLGFGS